MSEKTADYLLQLSNFTRTSGERKVIEALHENLLSGNHIDKIHRLLTTEVELRIVTPQRVVVPGAKKNKVLNFRVYDGDRHGVVIYIMHHHFGVAHETLSLFYKREDDKPITIPAVSQKYSKIAKMKKDTPKSIWLTKEISKIIANLPKIVGEKLVSNKKRARGYQD